MSTDPIRALCADMAAELDHICQCLLDDRTLTNPLANRARALLEADGPAVHGRGPASVAGQPSDEELCETLRQAVADFPPDHPVAQSLQVEQYHRMLELRKARAVLARWGNHSADASKMVSPAEGEVAELAHMLRGIAHWRRCGLSEEGAPSRFDIRQADRLDRAAEMLERQAAPVPVPVAERLPGPEDCDAKGRCWLTSTAPGTFPGWILDDPEQCVDWDRWLPAHALPLPTQAGEVQP